MNFMRTSIRLFTVAILSLCLALQVSASPPSWDVGKYTVSTIKAELPAPVKIVSFEVVSNIQTQPIPAGDLRQIDRRVEKTNTIETYSPINNTVSAGDISRKFNRSDHNYKFATVVEPVGWQSEASNFYI